MGSNPVGVTRRKQSALLCWLFCFGTVSGFEYGAAEQFPHFCGDCGALCAAQRKQSEKPGVAFQRVGRTGGNPVGVTKKKTVSTFVLAVFFWCSFGIRIWSRGAIPVFLRRLRSALRRATQAK